MTEADDGKSAEKIFSRNGCLQRPEEQQFFFCVEFAVVHARLVAETIRGRGRKFRHGRAFRIRAKIYPEERRVEDDKKSAGHGKRASKVADKSFRGN